jgi:hypothetical protein
MTVAAPLRLGLPRVANLTGTVVCLATGPSLTASDVDYCRGKALVIAVNDAHRLAPWADVLYSGDRYWWQHHRGVPSFTGCKVGIEHAAGRHSRDVARLIPGLIWMRLTGHHGVETAADGLRSCGYNSGGQAVNLAVHLGARRIVLLGYDMGVTGAKRHFFGDHPVGLSNQHNFPTWRTAFATMREPMTALGVAVVNCSRSTSLDAFQTMALEDAL